MRKIDLAGCDLGADRGGLFFEIGPGIGRGVGGGTKQDVADDELRAVNLAMMRVEPRLAVLRRAILTEVMAPDELPRGLTLQGRVIEFARMTLRGLANFELLLRGGQVFGARLVARLPRVSQDQPAIDDFFQRQRLGHRQGITLRAAVGRNRVEHAIDVGRGDRIAVNRGDEIVRAELARAK